VEPDRDSEDRLEPGPESSESQPPELAPQLGNLLSGTIAVDLTAWHRGMDQFFSRLEDLEKELPAGSVLVRLAPWLVTVTVATAGLELARWQFQRQSPRRAGWIARPTLDES
jgi:hypothetical protein